MASHECQAAVTPVPQPYLDFDPTEMEDELRRWTRAPDLSYLRESLVKTKRWVADAAVSWPEEAVRRTVLKLLFEAGFEQLPAIVAMPDRLAAYILAHVA